MILPQVPERILCEARVVAMGEEVEPVNDLYLSMKMVFLTSAENLNHVAFQSDFIEGVVEDQAKLVTMPVVVDVANLVAGKYDKLTHKYKNGKFGTNQIGGFYKFETNQNGEVLELIAYARIWKRDDKVIASLEELYGSDEGLKFSYECLIGQYVSENGTKKISKNPLNSPIGSAVVSFPAVLASKALLLAETYKENFIDNQIQGGDILARSKDLTQEQFFANAKIHLISELDMTQIQRKIFNYCRESMGEEWWNFDVVEFSINYFILMRWDDGDYYKISYSIDSTGNELTFSPKVKVSKNYTEIPEEDVNMATLAEVQAKLETAELKIKDLEKTASEKDTAIAEKEKLVKENETALATANTAIAAKEADIVKLGESITTKDAEIATLTPFKAQVEKAELEKAEAEKATKKTVLTEKCSKILSKDEMETAEMKKAIEDLDENYCNKILAEKYVANVTKPDGKKTMVTASKILDDTLKIGGSDVVSKYITINN